MGLRVTWSRSLSRAEADAYDQFVEDTPSAAYPQVRSYAALATAGRAFSPRYFLVRDTAKAGAPIIGTALVLRARGPANAPLPAAIVERGPVCALSDLRQVLVALHAKTLSRGIARLVVMPYFAGDDAKAAEAILASCKYRVAHDFSSAHARTLRLDLRGKTKDEIFAGKEGKTVRQEVRNAAKAGATTRRGTRADVATFARLYGEMMAGQERGTKAASFFEALADRLENEPKRAALFITEIGNAKDRDARDGRAKGSTARDGGAKDSTAKDGAAEAVSVAYVARHRAITTYVMGASSAVDRPFTKAAPSVAAAVEWACEMGCDTFDLGGIPLEGDTDPKRASIAAFKLKFAKTPVTLVREHARWL